MITRFRRVLGLGVGAALLLVAPVALAHDGPGDHTQAPRDARSVTEAVLVGEGANTYQSVPNWCQIPEGRKNLGPTHGGVIVDKKGEIYFSMNSGDEGLLVYGADGKMIKGIGGKDLVGIHGICLNEENGEEFIYGAMNDKGKVVKLKLDGTVVWTIGVPMESGKYKAANQYHPTGVAVGPDGSVYVLDTYNQAIRRIKDSMVTTLVGGDGIIGLIDGPGTAARLGAQAGMTFARGQLFVSDVGSARIRAITPGDDASTTRVVTFAGSGRLALEDGSGDVASLAAPMALAAASDGTIWLADAGNKAIRRMAPAR